MRENNKGKIYDETFLFTYAEYLVRKMEVVY